MTDSPPRSEPRTRCPFVGPARCYMWAGHEVGDVPHAGSFEAETAHPTAASTDCGCECHGTTSWVVCQHCRPDLIEPTAASADALRAALERARGTRVTHCSIGNGPQFHATEEGCNFDKRGPECDCAERWAEVDAALASSLPPTEGLDVERLAAALEASGVSYEQPPMQDAQRVAAEYVRLSSPKDQEKP